jgi:hypothetical protein
VILNEADSSIDLVYSSTTDANGLRIVGVQNDSGLVGTTYYYSGGVGQPPVPTPGTSLHFTPLP